MNILVYDKTTGRIAFSLQGSESDVLKEEALGEHGWVETPLFMGGEIENKYVDLETKKLVDKSELYPTVKVIGLSVFFTNLPINTQIICEGNVLVCDASGGEFEFEIPGVYEFSFYPSPQYKDVSLEVTVG